MRTVLGEIGRRALNMVGDGVLEAHWGRLLAERGPDAALIAALSLWATECSKPLVLLIDEVDALIGDSLISVLRQLRAGYDQRPAQFPQSVILCGVRDVRDYRIESTAENAVIAGGNAFNIRTESLRLADFTPAEVSSLFAQHAEATGETCTEEALALIHAQTQGQPWLVNALGYDIFFRHRTKGAAATAAHVRDACERLVLRRDAHLEKSNARVAQPHRRQTMLDLRFRRCAGVGIAALVAATGGSWRSRI